MRGGLLLALALLAASPFLPGLVPAAPALAPDPALESFAVIALVDTGINPYHDEFQAPWLTAHPSTFVRGYPAQAEPLSLCLDAALSPDCRTLAGARARDATTWAGVERTTRRAGGWGPLYYIPGTRIVGAVSIGEEGDPFVAATRVFDDHGHGTATASLAAGSSLGLCPACLIVVVEGPGDEALEWARAQPWIDVVSNSWGLVANLDFPPPPVGTSNARTTREMVLEGKTVLFSAGNGPGLPLVPGATDAGEYLVPAETTYTSSYTGPDWVVSVGAMDPENGQPVAGSARPVDVVAAGLDVRAADGRARSGAVGFAGTSASAPIAAGVVGHVLLEARRALGDHDEGPGRLGAACEVLASGPAQPRAAVLDTARECGPPLRAGSGAPLADGLLVRDELQRAVFATARACPLGAASRACAPRGAEWPFPARVWGWTLPTPPAGGAALIGYGALDQGTRDAAARAVLGLEPLPARPDADPWAAGDSFVRQRLWGFWPHGARASDLAAR